jgi:hypothetical protein
VLRPTEGELIELENKVLRQWQARACADGSSDYEYRICRTLEACIAIVRDPSELLRTIPDDDEVDRQIRRAIAPAIPQKARPAQNKKESTERRP